MNKSQVSALTAMVVTAIAVLYAGVCAASGWDPSLGWLLQAVIHLGELAAVAEVVDPHAQGLGNTLFSVAPVLTGVGLVTAGVAILRRRRSSWLPLALGLYTVIVLIPVMIGTGGPPSRVALVTIAGWDVLWLLVAGSVLEFAPRPRPASVMVEQSSDRH